MNLSIRSKNLMQKLNDRSILFIFIKSCYKKPSFWSYNKMTIVGVKLLKLFYADDGRINAWSKARFFITTFNKDKWNASVIQLLEAHHVIFCLNLLNSYIWWLCKGWHLFFITSTTMKMSCYRAKGWLAATTLVAIGRLGRKSL